jgi:hypothetical protein
MPQLPLALKLEFTATVSATPVSRVTLIQAGP